MYKINISWIIAVFSLLLTTACSDLLDKENERVVEGEPTQCTLTINASDNTVLSRATSPEKVEKDINNLFIFIFTDENIVSSKYFEKKDITISGTTGSVTLATTSGDNRHIYAIANLGLGMMNLTKADLEKVTNEADLKALNTNLLQEITARGTSFVMSGFVENTDKTIKDVTIPATTNNTSTALGTIKLKKLDSKIQFNIATASGVTFTPRDWRVIKVPKNASLFTSTSDKFTKETDYFNTAWANFEGEGAKAGKTFAFYVLENKNTPKMQIPATNTSGTYLTAEERYAYRESQEKISIPSGGSQKPGQTVVNGSYIYANANATYVQLRGHVQYKNGTSNVSADVIYTIHLGYADADPNDYNTLRNTFYTYTVTINSIDNISTEVTNNTEPQPGAEGTVTLASELHTFDAHYESVSIAFPSTIMDNSLTWYVQTAFSKGGASEHPKDYKWILFKLSTKPTGGTYSTNLAFYPGDANIHTSPITLDWYMKNPTTLLDVDQLVTILKENGQRLKDGNTNTLFDSNNDIRFTAFVNENYYKTNPLNGTASTELWKQFVNQPERILNILTDTKYSQDGASMNLKAMYSFRQASIQTIYSVDYDNPGDQSETAWGCEMIQDTKTYSETINNMSSTGANSLSNGRKNTLALWDDVVNKTSSWSMCITESTGELQTTYNKIKYTCLKKNRDGNGDKKIDSDEVQWYLASLNQLTDIWLGEKSLNLKSRLHEGTNTSTNNYDERIYISSSMNNNNDPWTLWSAEGSSVSNYSPNWVPKDKQYYRCVRNLGMVDSDASQPNDFATYTPSAAGDAVIGRISLKKMDKKSIRSYTQVGDLQEHHERQSDNLPWTEFDVLRAFTPADQWTELDTKIKAGTKVCADGYRVPNQRELSLMYSRISGNAVWNNGNNDFFCRTKFSLNSNRASFAISANGANMNLFSSGVDNTGVVRCVKDIK